MQIVNFMHSFQEFPNEFPLVLFSAGCNLNCRGCYNKAKITSKGSYLDALRLLKTEVNPLTKSVVLLGGEPTIWHDIVNICENIKDMKLKVKLFTNGMRPEVISLLANKELLDFVSLDLKCVKNCSDVLGTNIPDEVYLETIKETVEALVWEKVPFEIRTTVFPEVVEQLVEIKQWKKDNIPDFYFDSYENQLVEHIIQEDFRGLCQDGK